MAVRGVVCRIQEFGVIDYAAEAFVAVCADISGLEVLRLAAGDDKDTAFFDAAAVGIAGLALAVPRRVLEGAHLRALPIDFAAVKSEICRCGAESRFAVVVNKYQSAIGVDGDFAIRFDVSRSRFFKVTFFEFYQSVLRCARAPYIVFADKRFADFVRKFVRVDLDAEVELGVFVQGLVPEHLAVLGAACLAVVCRLECKVRGRLGLESGAVLKGVEALTALLKLLRISAIALFVFISVVFVMYVAYFTRFLELGIVHRGRDAQRAHVLVAFAHGMGITEAHLAAMEYLHGVIVEIVIPGGHDA